MKKFLYTAVAAVSLLAVPAATLAATYKDVPNDHWASSTIEWGISQGIVTDHTLNPDDPISEEGFVDMLISSYVGNSYPGIVKYEVNPYFYVAHGSDSFYYYAYEKNYPVKGWESIESRQKPILRTEVAEIVVGVSGVNYTGDNAIKYLLDKGLAKGKMASVSVAGYRGSDFLTRAEAIQFIKNIKESGLKELKERPIKQSNGG